jgi:hypothetical protein
MQAGRRLKLRIAARLGRALAARGSEAGTPHAPRAAMEPTRERMVRVSRAWLAAGVAVLGLVAIWSWQQASRRGESPQPRAEMYRAALENVRARCTPPSRELESYCRDNATLLLDYPECDAACVSLVRHIRGEPTR